jgi:hypothetical protein
MDATAGARTSPLAQLVTVIAMRIARRRDRALTAARPAAPPRTSDDAAFEAHVDQALRIARGLPALRTVDLDDAERGTRALEVVDIRERESRAARP